MAQASNAQVKDGVTPTRPAEGSSTPSGIGYAVAAGVTVLMAGAVYLIAVRGEALIVDLGKLGRIFCF